MTTIDEVAIIGLAAACVFVLDLWLQEYKRRRRLQDESEERARALSEWWRANSVRDQIITLTDDIPALDLQDGQIPRLYDEYDDDEDQTPSHNRSAS